jgi:hypothetical protein
MPPELEEEHKGDITPEEIAGIVERLDEVMNFIESEEEYFLRDTLCNLRHWADAKGQDYNAAIDAAYHTYMAESEGL